MNELTVVIVNFNSTGHLIKCLSSLQRDPSSQSMTIVVVDNASKDQAELKEALRDAPVRLLLNPDNLGFASACNRGIRSCPAPFFLLMNPDVLVHDLAVSRTLTYLKTRSGTGVVGCRILNPDGSLQLACRRSIPTVRNAFYRFAGLSRLFPGSRKFGEYNLTYLNEDETQRVEAVSGSFLMFRQELIDSIGLLDEQFFLYGEDLDYCYRAGLAGWDVEYFAGASVTHLKSQSSDQRLKSSTFHFFNAMKIFYRKHYSPASSQFKTWLVMAGIDLAYLGRRALQRVSRKPRVASPH